MLLREETPNYKIHLSGTSALADVELLALLIAGESSYSMKKARTVLTAIGSLKELGKCTFQELETLTLTQKEKTLLEYLCLNPNKILKREDILIHVWGKNDFFLGRSMDVFMARLRKYLNTQTEIYIETIHGIGYRFSPM